MRTTFNMLAASAILLTGFSMASAAEPTPAGGLTEATLRDMLDDEGFEVITKTNSEGGKYYVIGFTKNKIDFKLTVDISPSRTKLWLSTSFTGVPTADKLSPEQLMKMLASNSKSATFFVVDEKSKEVYLKRHFDNRSVTRATLRAELDRFTSDVTELRPVWKDLQAGNAGNAGNNR